MEKKKIGLVGALLMGIGCIIGTGIFGSLPEVAADVGPGIFYAFIAAAVVVIFRSVCRMYSSAALPTSASSFMHATKLMHPGAGALISISVFLEPTLLSLYGVLFAEYFLKLFPGVEMSNVGISLIFLLVCLILAWFGNKVSILSGNGVVVLLLAAIGVYVFIGMPNIDPDNISFASIIAPGVGITTLAAAAGVLTSSLSGSSVCAELADEIKNPEKNVPLALVLAPAIVAVIYILMAVVTIGVVPYNELTSLSQVAEHFLSPSLMIFFIVGGPIAGIVTSIIPLILGCVAKMQFSSKQGFLPEIFQKENKHGTPVLSLFVTVGICMGICATGATFGVIMTVYSFINNIAEIPNTLMPIFAHKKYPKICDNSFLHMNHKLATVLAIITCGIMVYLSVAMALTLNAIAVVGVLAVYAVGYIYFYFRIKYLKGKGRDLVAEMAAPYAPWEEKEASYK